ncbi:hypothetical protein DUNSADRAFT_7456 [Dunaliella salina]|uniref:Encoded protein n=1 Tax=Dunaliella salina TaxID=3046 RepID=A0ABQ7GLC9_DUNSA|nr:hypothetical protein DUNSADRAFT_7456 [Dunaliella salina]|eukprot:KAF5835421.1 hypothetical protein DUNSADRAFT_7456 [Dunaliella salina]
MLHCYLHVFRSCAINAQIHSYTLEKTVDIESILTAFPKHATLKTLALIHVSFDKPLLQRCLSSPHLMERLSTVVEVGLEGCKLKEGAATLFARIFPRLSALHLVDCSSSCQFLVGIQDPLVLQSLEVQGPEAVLALQAISRFVCLQNLEVSTISSGFSRVDVSILGSLYHLKKLTLFDFEGKIEFTHAESLLTSLQQLSLSHSIVGKVKDLVEWLSKGPCRAYEVDDEEGFYLEGIEGEFESSTCTSVLVAMRPLQKCMSFVKFLSIAYLKFNAEGWKEMGALFDQAAIVRGIDIELDNNLGLVSAVKSLRHLNNLELCNVERIPFDLFAALLHAQLASSPLHITISSEGNEAQEEVLIKQWENVSASVFQPLCVSLSFVRFS